MGHEIPASSFAALNPLTIILLGPLVSAMMTGYRLWKSKTLPQTQTNPIVMMGVGFLLLALSFLLLMEGCRFPAHSGLDGAPSGAMVSLMQVVPGFCLIALSELWVGPTIYGLAHQLSPVHLRARMMGLVVLGASLANLLSGYVAKIFVNHSIEEAGSAPSATSLAVFYNGFQSITITAFIMALLIIAVGTVFRKQISQLCEKKE